MSISTPRPARPGSGVAPSRPTRHGDLTTQSAWWFFVATFVLSWGVGALVVSFMDQVGFVAVAVAVVVAVVNRHAMLRREGAAIAVLMGEEEVTGSGTEAATAGGRS